MLQVFICQECGAIYRNDPAVLPVCEDCDVDTIDSGYDDSSWTALPASKKLEIISNVKKGQTSLSPNSYSDAHTQKRSTSISSSPVSNYSAAMHSKEHQPANPNTISNYIKGKAYIDLPNLYRSEVLRIIRAVIYTILAFGSLVIRDTYNIHNYNWETVWNITFLSLVVFGIVAGITWIIVFFKWKEAKDYQDRAKRYKREEFFSRCKSSNIESIKSKDDLKKARKIAKEIGLKGYKLEAVLDNEQKLHNPKSLKRIGERVYILCADKGINPNDNEDQLTIAYGALVAAGLKIERDYIRQYYNAGSERFLRANYYQVSQNRIQRKKRINELLNEKTRLQAELDNNDQSAYALAQGAMLFQQKEKDWAIHGGIASGIGGPVIGGITAMNTIAENQQIRAQNEINRRAFQPAFHTVFNNRGAILLKIDDIDKELKPLLDEEARIEKQETLGRKIELSSKAASIIEELKEEEKKRKEQEAEYQNSPEYKQEQKKRKTKIIISTVAMIIVLFLVFLVINKFINITNIAKYGEFYVKTKIGDTITYGNYEQDNNAENGKEPIEWVVLQKDHGKMLLISKKIIDHYSRTDKNYWKGSEARNWLNTDFISSSFTEKEKAQIELSTLESNGFYDTFYIHGSINEKDKTTEDKIFLLSKSEAINLFEPIRSNKYIIAQPTNYAIFKGVEIITNDKSEKIAEWALRDYYYDPMGIKEEKGVMYVDSNGEIQTVKRYYIGQEDAGLGLRPAMWISPINNTAN